MQLASYCMGISERRTETCWNDWGPIGVRGWEVSLYVAINFLAPDKPNVGLGFRLCPRGDQTLQHEHTMAAIKSMCQRVSGAHLTEAETRQALHQRLVSKLWYPLHLTNFTKAQCKPFNTRIYQIFLPSVRLNRNMTNVVIVGPKVYGRMEFPET